MSVRVFHMGQADPVSVGRISDVVASQLTAQGFVTLRDKADATGIKKSTLHRRLSKTNPKPFTAPELFQIAAALGTTVSELVGAAEDAA
jgi:DNA-binding Xre family transcriptional regulator